MSRSPPRSVRVWWRRASSTSPEVRRGARRPVAPGGADRFRAMKVGLIGAGNMARAMARGWGDPVLCSDSGSGRAQALADELGGGAGSHTEVAAEADVVILCHKPYQLEAVAQEISGQVKVVVSVLGGVTGA